MGWKTPYEMMQKGNCGGVQAISAQIGKEYESKTRSMVCL